MTANYSGASLNRHASAPHRRGAPNRNNDATSGLSKRSSVTWADANVKLPFLCWASSALLMPVACMQLDTNLRQSNDLDGLGLSALQQDRLMKSPSSATSSSHKHQRSYSNTTESLSPSSDRYYADEAADDLGSSGPTTLRRHQSLNLRSSPGSRRSTTSGASHSRGSSEDISISLRSSPSTTGFNSRPRSQSTAIDGSASQGASPTFDGGRAFPLLNGKRTSASGSNESGGSSPLRSPIDGISRTPWSPTAEEVAMFGGAQKSPSLDASFAQMDISATNPSYKQLSTNSTSSNGTDATYRPTLAAPLTRPSLPPVASPLGRKITPALPPLVTSFGSTSREQGSPHSGTPAGKSPLAFQGPFSAAPYVRPIGHSSVQKASDPLAAPKRQAVQLHDKGAFTAAPGTSDIWQRQKASVAGLSPALNSPQSRRNEAHGIEASSQMRRGPSGGGSRLNSAVESPGVQQHQQPFSVAQQMQLLAALQHQQSQFPVNQVEGA